MWTFLWKHISLALFSTFNFMFAPVLGASYDFTFFETTLTVLIGGFASAFVFYYGSSYFIQRSARMRSKKLEKIMEKGSKIPKRMKKFTKTNRRIIRMKKRVNKYFIFWAFPLFLSIPGGCIIVAKFYKHYRYTFPLILLFLTLDSLVIGVGAYYVSDLIQ